MNRKIERVPAGAGYLVFRVSGRIDGVRVNELLELIESEKTSNSVALDLKEVTVVSLEAVRALTIVEANGIEIQNCPAYIRAWISQAKEWLIDASDYYGPHVTNQIIKQLMRGTLKTGLSKPSRKQRIKTCALVLILGA